MLPIHLHAFLGPLPGPRLQHLLGSGLTWTLDEIHAPPQRLLYPVLALVLSTIACVQPQMRKAGKVPVRLVQEGLDPLIIHHLGTVDLCLEHEAFGIHQDMALSSLDLPPSHLLVTLRRLKESLP